MSEYIMRFDGEYRFLSNFWKCDVEFEGHTYPSSEHAYQAAKTSNGYEREAIRNEPSCGAIKHMGRKVELRKDWEQIKDSIMLGLVKAKFSTHKDLEDKLLATGDKILVEGNTWHDCHFGVCSCDKCHGQGENKLGEILMQVRAELKHKETMAKVNAELQNLSASSLLYDKNDRTHEECDECAKEKVEPQPCKGHVAGPSHCPEFQAKDSGDIVLEQI